MKALIAVVFVAVLFAACSPMEPTGYLVGDVSGDSQQIISYEVYRENILKPVRITVRSEVLADSIFIDGTEVELSGAPTRYEGYLADRGTVVTRLDPGQHRVIATICSEGIIRTSCERVQRTITV